VCVLIAGGGVKNMNLLHKVTAPLTQCWARLARVRACRECPEGGAVVQLHVDLELAAAAVTGLTWILNTSAASTRSRKNAWLSAWVGGGHEQR